MNRMTKEYINKRMLDSVERKIIENYFRLYGKADTINIMKGISNNYFTETMVYNKCYGHIFDIGYYIKELYSYNDDLIDILYDAVYELEEKYEINITTVINKQIERNLIDDEMHTKFHTLSNFFQLLYKQDKLCRRSIKKALMEIRFLSNGRVN